MSIEIKIIIALSVALFFSEAFYLLTLKYIKDLKELHQLIIESKTRTALYYGYYVGLKEKAGCSDEKLWAELRMIELEAEFDEWEKEQNF